MDTKYNPPETGGQMGKAVETIFSIGNLYFLLIIAASIFLAYLTSVILNSVSIIIEERKPWLTLLVDMLAAPFLMFVMNVGYGIGFGFLRLPSSIKPSWESSTTIVLIINLGLLVVNAVPVLLLRLVNTLSSKAARSIKAALALVIGLLIIALFAAHYAALTVSAVFAFIFFLITSWLLSVPKPKIAEQPVIPKRLVIAHVYISTAEPHEKIAEAIDVIHEAIAEIPGVGEKPHASLSGFIPNAVDVLIKYFVLDAMRIEETKEKVNLNILKKLNERKIKLSAA